jgi:hypothetical protein
MLVQRIRHRQGPQPTGIGRQILEENFDVFVLYSVKKVPSDGKRAVSKLVAKSAALFNNNEIFYNMSHNTCVKQE